MKECFHQQLIAEDYSDVVDQLGLTMAEEKGSLQAVARYAQFAYLCLLQSIILTADRDQLVSKSLNLKSLNSKDLWHAIRKKDTSEK